VKLTTHLHLVPRSKNEWNYTSTRGPYSDTLGKRLFNIKIRTGFWYQFQNTDTDGCADVVFSPRIPEEPPK